MAISKERILVIVLICVALQVNIFSFSLKKLQICKRNRVLTTLLETSIWFWMEPFMLKLFILEQKFNIEYQYIQM